MPYGPVVEDRHVGKIPPDIYQDHTHFFFIITDTGVSRRQRLQNQMVNTYLASLQRAINILGGRYRRGDDMHFHFEAHAGHTHGILDARLFVDSVLLRDDVDDFAIIWDGDGTGGINSLFYILLPDFIIGA